MWDHPLTGKQIDTLKEFGYHQVPPIEKTLMCGDKGVGAMASVESIVQTFSTLIQQVELGQPSST